MKDLHRHVIQIMQNSNPRATLKSIDWHWAHQGLYANWSRMQSSYSASYDEQPCAKNLDYWQNHALCLSLLSAVIPDKNFNSKEKRPYNCNLQLTTLFIYTPLLYFFYSSMTLIKISTKYIYTLYVMSLDQY